MTPDGITARNRANAQKSTGPRSAAGKAIVAGNARRHGLTGRLDPENVARWLAVILDRPRITPADLMPEDGPGYAALALAEAEARLVAAETALRAFEAGQGDPGDGVDETRQTIAAIRHAMLTEGGSPGEMLAALKLLQKLSKADADATAIGGKRHRLLKRYLREARSRRRRALRDWVAIQEAGRAAA